MSEVPQNEAAEARNRRKVRRGVVVSNKMEKTVVVLTERRVQHPLYGKTVRKSTRVKAHADEACNLGDVVDIMETRPISREKRWRVVTIVERAK